MFVTKNETQKIKDWMIVVQCIGLLQLEVMIFVVCI